MQIFDAIVAGSALPSRLRIDGTDPDSRATLPGGTSTGPVCFGAGAGTGTGTGTGTGGFGGSIFAVGVGVGADGVGVVVWVGRGGAGVVVVGAFVVGGDVPVIGGIAGPVL